MNASSRTKRVLTTVKSFIAVALAVCAILLMTHIRTSSAQQAAGGLGAGRGGRGGIPNATPAQTAALAQMNSGLAPLTQAIAAARSALRAAAFAEPRNDAEIQAKVAAVKAADLALASAQAGAFAKIQATPDKLSSDQVAAIARNAGGGRGGVAVRAPSAPERPDISGDEGRAINAMNSTLLSLTRAVQTARIELASAALAEPRDNAGIESKADAVNAAELALAKGRADAFSRLQASPNKLGAEQVTSLIAMDDATGGFTQPEPLDFNFHQAYVSLFDGVSLKGWDGNPKFWRAENGAIIGESTPTNPSGNTYLVCHLVEAHDFTLKLEIKIEGSGGSGIQYRSKTGLPWLANIPPEVTANVGPVNLNWMLTGPQADFWPTNGNDTFSGQFYVENDPMRIMAWRGQVVQGAGPGTRRLMGNIGDQAVLAGLIKKNDWNQYTIIARGGTFVQIINGQLMSVMVDDDPKSTSNQSGLFGIEMEAITKVSVRNIWLKRLN